MDTTKTITHVSLCAGYGGIDIGLKRSIPSLRTIAFSEIEAFACANLVSKMEAGLLDPAPIWTDIKTFPWGGFHGRVDILSGGYPCQPFSAAGKRLGTEDHRHLWPYIAAGIQLMRPALCFFENVEGHVSLGLRAVIAELAYLGYEATWGVFSAAEVGAPHQRKRVFILAHRIGTGLERYAGHGHNGHEPGWQSPEAGGPIGAGGLWPSRPGEPQHEWEPPRVVCYAERKGLDGPTGQGMHGTGWPSEQSASGCESWTIGQAQPPLGRDPDGPAGRLDYAKLCITSDNRTDELRLLGNGVVPATAHKAFVTLLDELNHA